MIIDFEEICWHSINYNVWRVNDYTTYHSSSSRIKHGQHPKTRSCVSSKI